MRNNETGEFELVVGDKQLLSAFFIGVLLLAVVFAMGYVLGRGSPKSATVAPETAAAPPVTPPDINRPPAAPAAATLNPEPVAGTQPPQTADAPPTTATQTAATEQPAASAPPVEPPPQPTTVPAKEASPPPAPRPKAPPAPAAEPGSGTYWQVHAGSQSSVDALAESLKGRGFPVATRPGPNNLILVWVGPYSDKESLSRAKKQLQDLGFSSIFKKP